MPKVRREPQLRRSSVLSRPPPPILQEDKSAAGTGLSHGWGTKVDLRDALPHRLP